jgi:drug/metabolite transporter (DMT)-like permease
MTPTLSPGVRGHGSASPVLSPATTGLIAGITAAFVWAAYLVTTKAGTAAGLLPQDFLMLRFATAAAITLPWLMRHNLWTLGGIGWRRGIVLTLFAGPPFIVLTTSGYVFAPLAHGAVIQPSTIALSSMLTAALFLKERLTGDKIVGAGLIVAGLVAISSHAGAAHGPHVWIGDLLFVLAGLSWTAFTILMKRWAVDGLAVTAAVSFLSALVVVPTMLVSGGLGRLATLPLSALITQVVVQGIASGVLALIAFGIAVRHLGAAKAGLFPAIVPAGTLLLGAVTMGSLPSTTESIGAGLATLGLVTAIGLVRPLFALTPLRTPARG